MIRTLEEAVRAGEPLIDIVVRFKDGVDFVAATETANVLGPDIELHEEDWPRLVITRPKRNMLELQT